MISSNQQSQINIVTDTLLIWSQLVIRDYMVRLWQMRMSELMYSQ